MKIFISTLLFHLAVLLNSAELSSQACLGRSKQRIFPEPTVGLYIHSYEDAYNHIHPLTVGSRVTLGTKQLAGIDFIIGIVQNRVMRPIFDADGSKFLVNMRYNLKFILSSTGGVPYGLKPEHTIEAIVAYPPPQPPPQAHHHK